MDVSQMEAEIPSNWQNQPALAWPYSSNDDITELRSRESNEELLEPRMFSRIPTCLALFVIAAAMNVGMDPARAGERFALLIGNQAYSKEVGPLKNPRNDVELVGASLRKLGFRTQVLIDANYRQMDISIKRYLAEVRRAGPGAISFLYYSGHGVAQPETQINYILPVDIVRADGDLWYSSFEQQAIIDRMKRQAPGATHFVVFDACRNELNLSGSAAKSIGTNKGFVPIANTAGILIAYATAPGKTASDVGSNGGPYARALAEELLRPGVESVGMFRRVQLKVASAISQEPWLNYGSLPELFLAGRRSRDAVRWDEISNSEKIAHFDDFLKRYPSSPFSQSARLKLDLLNVRKLNSAARRDWKKLASSNDIDALEGYLRRYPNQAYAFLARNRIAKLRMLPQPSADQAPAKTASGPAAKQKLAATKSRTSSSDAFNLTKAIGSCSAYEYFLREYPTGFFANLAKAWRQKNCQPEAKQIALAKPPTPAALGNDTELGEKELARQLQSQLKRVGCYRGKVDGVWGSGSRRSLKDFSRFASVALTDLTPTSVTIKIVTKKKVVVCPAAAAKRPIETKPKVTQTHSVKKNCISFGTCMKRCRNTSTGGNYCPSWCSGSGRMAGAFGNVC